MKNEARVIMYLEGPNYTLWTWIKYNEKSKDPAHCRRVKKHMLAILEAMRKAGEVKTARSLKGKRSYRRK